MSSAGHLGYVRHQLGVHPPDDVVVERPTQLHVVHHCVHQDLRNGSELGLICVRTNNRDPFLPGWRRPLSSEGPAPAPAAGRATRRENSDGKGAQSTVIVAIRRRRRNQGDDCRQLAQRPATDGEAGSTTVTGGPSPWTEKTHRDLRVRLVRIGGHGWVRTNDPPLVSSIHSVHRRTSASLTCRNHLAAVRPVRVRTGPLLSSLLSAQRQPSSRSTCRHTSSRHISDAGSTVGAGVVVRCRVRKPGGEGLRR